MIKRIAFWILRQEIQDLRSQIWVENQWRESALSWQAYVRACVPEIEVGYRQWFLDNWPKKPRPTP